MTVETGDKRQDELVSSGGWDRTALSPQPLRQAWLSCSALNLNGKGRRRQKKDILGDRKGKTEERTELMWTDETGEVSQSEERRCGVRTTEGK